ncbi:hypothetical protein [Amycolatopsis sp. NPDC021455]|uniref:hypothetical protein n=1 Tax=Amycolatopsis sp. NPDC021455 TaxID=3154901 RepID=UPI0033D56751
MTHPQYPGQPQQQPYPAPTPQPGQPFPPDSQPFPGQPPQPGAQQPYPGQSQQPFPGQPPYPASSGFPAQPYPGQPSYPGTAYPPAPYPAMGYGMQPPKPNGATAIIAGILAVLGGLLYLVGLIGGIVTLASLGPLWMGLLVLVQNIVLAGTLLPGGILLFLRKPVGRVLTIIGSGLAILLSLVSVVMSAAGVWYYSGGLGGMYAGAAFVGLLMVLIPAGATLVLAIVKPTARWCGRAEPGYPPR